MDDNEDHGDADFPKLARARVEKLVGALKVIEAAYGFHAVNDVMDRLINLWSAAASDIDLVDEIWPEYLAWRDQVNREYKGMMDATRALAQQVQDKLEGKS